MNHLSLVGRFVGLVVVLVFVVGPALVVSLALIPLARY
ncbi:hypothetical protein DD749_08190 [Helicobacter pylori]|nr:hypothetical protein DD749_08190 [Helicobacter pylori]